MALYHFRKQKRNLLCYFMHYWLNKLVPKNEHTTSELQILFGCTALEDNWFLFAIIVAVDNCEMFCMIVSPVFLNTIVVLIGAKRYLYSGINMAL